MDTLYDLLGALPHDDAEGLRSAFRRAVKGAHPDIRPGDPDAAIKFRQIVRANEILGDRDQRAVYDHLLLLAQHEKDPAASHPIAAKVHKIASGVMALASASVVTVGGYLVFVHVSMALVAPAGSLAASSSSANIDLTSRLSASIAAVTAIDAPDPAALSAFIARREGSRDNSAAGATAPAAPPLSEAEDAATGIRLPDSSPDYVNFFQARSVSAFGNGDLNGALADINQAMLLDQKFAISYADRDMLFFQAAQDERGFDDIAPAPRPEKPAHPKPVVTAAVKPHTDALPKVVPLPLPRPHTGPRFMMRPRSWYASTAGFH